MKFQILDKNDKISKNSVYLLIDQWDDYKFKTMFYLGYCNENGERHPIGNIKIGFKNQKIEKHTSQFIIEINNSKTFDKLPSDYFSLGQDSDYYNNLYKLPDDIRIFILKNLNDVVENISLFDKFQDENIMKTSLLRDIRDNTVREQFTRILQEKSPLTNFNFSFIRNETEKIGKIELEFNVLPQRKPSTNIHAIIGRNGVGKTTLLNGMINSFLNKNEDLGDFFIKEEYDFWGKNKLKKISDDYFSYLVAVSFSVFDPFVPKKNKIVNKQDKNKIKNYFYVGLKESNGKLKEPNKYFEDDFLTNFDICKNYEPKKKRWLTAIETLKSDDNFSSMGLEKLLKQDNSEIVKTISKMSSGHASILLIITQLVAKVEEKTLVLLDEPESHLHPPLLSAFIRALSELLDDRNGVAIIATHSPVVLQEIPKSCVWKLARTGKETRADRLTNETFGENVGVLTREVFGLEVNKSGFYKLLSDSVEDGGTYEEILESYNNQLGTEGRLLLKTLIRLRDEKIEENGDDKT